MDTNIAMQPLVSIILPTYNGAKYIAAAIASVQAQSYTNWELIIIDDGSTDDTEVIVQSLSHADSRIQYVKNEQNLGIQKTLNRGLALAKGEYIARIDDDDQWIDADKLTAQVSFLESHPDYVLVGTGVVIVTETGQEITRYTLSENDIAIRNRMLAKNCFAHGTVMYKKSAVNEVGGYSEQKNKRHIEDHDLWLRLGVIGKMYNLASHSVALMVRSTSITSRHRIIQAWRICKTALIYRNKYPYAPRGLLWAFLRMIFFIVDRIVPIPKRFLYKLQGLQRSI